MNMNENIEIPQGYVMSPGTEALADITKKIVKKAKHEVKTKLGGPGTIPLNKDNIKQFARACQTLSKYSHNRDLFNQALMGLNPSKYGRDILEKLKTAFKPSGTFSMVSGMLIYHLADSKIIQYKDSMEKEDWELLYTAHGAMMKKMDYITLKFIKGLYSGIGSGVVRPQPVGYLMNRNKSEITLAYKLGKIPSVPNGDYDSVDDMISSIRYSIGAESFSVDNVLDPFTVFGEEDVIEAEGMKYDYLVCNDLLDGYMVSYESYGIIEDYESMIGAEAFGFIKKWWKNRTSSKLLIDRLESMEINLEKINKTTDILDISIPSDLIFCGGTNMHRLSQIFNHKQYPRNKALEKVCLEKYPEAIAVELENENARLVGGSRNGQIWYYPKRNQLYTVVDNQTLEDLTIVNLRQDSGAKEVLAIANMSKYKPSEFDEHSEESVEEPRYRTLEEGIEALRDDKDSVLLIKEVTKIMNQERILKLALDKKLIKITKGNKPGSISISFSPLKDMEKVLTAEDIQPFGESLDEFLNELYHVFNDKVVLQMKEIIKTVLTGDSTVDITNDIDGSVESLMEELKYYEVGTEDLKDSVKKGVDYIIDKIKKLINFILSKIQGDKMLYKAQNKILANIKRKVASLKDDDFDKYPFTKLEKGAEVLTRLGKMKTHLYKETVKLSKVLDNPDDYDNQMKVCMDTYAKWVRAYKDSNGFLGMVAIKNWGGNTSNSTVEAMNNFKRTLNNVKIEYGTLNSALENIKKKLNSLNFDYRGIQGEQGYYRELSTLLDSVARVRILYIRSVAKVLQGINRVMGLKANGTESFDEYDLSVTYDMGEGTEGVVSGIKNFVSKVRNKFKTTIKLSQDQIDLIKDKTDEEIEKFMKDISEIFSDDEYVKIENPEWKVDFGHYALRLIKVKFDPNTEKRCMNFASMENSTTIGNVEIGYAILDIESDWITLGLCSNKFVKISSKGSESMEKFKAEKRVESTSNESIDNTMKLVKSIYDSYGIEGITNVIKNI